jgi:hypothetical protein
MSFSLPPHFEGHESKLKELAFYLRSAKMLFYITVMTMVVNALLTYGLLFHRPWGLSPEMCSRYCPLGIYPSITHENAILRIDGSLNPNMPTIAR